MKTQEKYKAIVMELAYVLSCHDLSTSEASYAAAMMFLGAVETNMSDFPDSMKEAYCVRIVQYYFAEKRKAQSNELNNDNP